MEQNESMLPLRLQLVRILMSPRHRNIGVGGDAGDFGLYFDSGARRWIAGLQETSTVKDPDATLERERLRPEAETQVLPQAPLMPFDATAQTPWAVPFAFDDYLELVDWTGRALREDKSGYIEAREPKILARLGIDGKQFIGYSEHLLKEFGTAVSAPASLTDLCARRQAKYLRGIQAARAMFVAKQAA